MTNQDAVKYVQQQLSAGVTDQIIRQSLLGAGWNEQSISEALNEAHGVSVPQVPQAPPSQSQQPATITQPQTSNSTLSFQEQYPLSVKKKFWKKFSLVAIIYGITLALLIVAPFVIVSSKSVSAFGMLGIIITIIYLIPIALYAWYVKAYIRTYYYDDNDSFITIRKGVITPREIHVQYSKVQDVYVDQDLLDRILGIYDVHLASATVTSGMEAHIDGVNADVAQRLKETLLARIQGITVKQTNAKTTSSGEQTVPHTQQEFKGDISSKTYPIQTRWLVGQVGTSIIYALLLGGVAGVQLNTNANDLVNNVTAGVVVGLTVFFLSMLYVFIWKKNYSFQFLPEYIVMHTGVISRSERHIPYNTVQDVNVDQPILGRIFGFVNVTIENATQGIGNASGISIPGQTPSNAKVITEAVKSILLTKDSSRTGL